MQIVYFIEILSINLLFVISLEYLFILVEYRELKLDFYGQVCLVYSMKLKLQICKILSFLCKTIIKQK